MNTEDTVALKKATNIIIKSAEKRVLKKAVLSKPSESSVLRAIITLKNISGRDMLQMEKFCSDNKALHKNFEVCLCN